MRKPMRLSETTLPPNICSVNLISHILALVYPASYFQRCLPVQYLHSGKTSLTTSGMVQVLGDKTKQNPSEDYPEEGLPVRQDGDHHGCTELLRTTSTTSTAWLIPMPSTPPPPPLRSGVGGTRGEQLNNQGGRQETRKTKWSWEI